MNEIFLGFYSQDEKTDFAEIPFTPIGLPVFDLLWVSIGIVTKTYRSHYGKVPIGIVTKSPIGAILKKFLKDVLSYCVQVQNQDMEFRKY